MDTLKESFRFKEYNNERYLDMDELHQFARKYLGYKRNKKRKDKILPQEVLLAYIRQYVGKELTQNNIDIFNRNDMLMRRIMIYIWHHDNPGWL